MVGAHIHTTAVVRLRHKFQHHPGTSGTLHLRCRCGGFPQQSRSQQRRYHAGNGGCGQTQLMGNFHSGNGAVQIDMAFDQIVIVLLQKLMIASSFVHAVILQIHCTLILSKKQLQCQQKHSIIKRLPHMGQPSLYTNWRVFCFIYNVKTVIPRLLMTEAGGWFFRCFFGYWGTEDCWICVR